MPPEGAGASHGKRPVAGKGNVESDRRTGDDPAHRRLAGLVGDVQGQFGRKGFKRQTGAGFIAKEPGKVSHKYIQQISYQLEQRCRDVDI